MHFNRQTSNASSTDTQWPPRSPHEALLASPSGRKKLRMLQDRTSPSPSPRKKLTSTSTFRERARRILEPESPSKTNEDEEEDEETIQLQLQAIEARLKLKRIQQAKVKAAAGSSDVESEHRRGLSAEAQARLARRSQHTMDRLRQGRSQPDLQIPLSPPPQKNAPEEQRSPGRVLLGIDKGLKGRDVSLRRAPSLRSGSSSGQAPSVDSRVDRRKQGITRSESTPALRAVAASKTYSEKLAEIRSTDRAHEERAERLRKTRNKGFAIDEKEVAGFKSAPTLSKGPRILEAPREFTREEVLQSYNQNASGQSNRRKAINDAKSTTNLGATPSSRAASSQASEYGIQSTRPPSRSRPDSTASENDVLQFESYSACHLSKRILPHNFLTRQFASKETYTIANLLKIVKSPEYDPPDVETDWILLATIASKSTPKNHKDDSTSKRNPEDGPKKFMAFTLTDLKYELTLYLFGSAFDRYWKMTPGTVVAVLNPSIMPPRAHLVDTGNFSITVNSSEDTILEIGTARDLGWCKSLKRDGHPCGQWVDLRHTEFCEYHVDSQVKKTKSSRMEVNTITAPFAPGGRGGPGYRGRGRGGRGGRGDGLRREGQQRDWETQSNYWIASTGSGHSTASLLDDNDIDPDAFHRGSTKDERLRRRLAEREKERTIAKELGKHGDGIGGEYLRRQHEDVSKDSSAIDVDAPDPVNAESLGLVGGIADNARLSPIKRKRALNSSSSSATAVGWGGANNRGLPEPTMAKASGEEPIKKKTRFVTAKGIREAGRESFGGEMMSSNIDNDDNDDDELEIVGGKTS
jgi:minichromosome maintenance protein 10